MRKFSIADTSVIVIILVFNYCTAFAANFYACGGGATLLNTLQYAAIIGIVICVCWFFLRKKYTAAVIALLGFWVTTVLGLTNGWMAYSDNTFMETLQFTIFWQISAC